MSLIKHILAVGLLITFLAPTVKSEVLIVYDEKPAMEAVASRLKTEEGIDSELVLQTNLPPSLTPFQAVIVYIHRELLPAPETAFINYAQAGGKLIILHHSISSDKRKNEHWFKFLGVSLPEGDVGQGGYKWIGSATWKLVNLSPTQFIMTNKVAYPEKIPYYSTTVAAPGGTLPGFTLEDDEVYLNHVHTGPRTLLMGLKYTNPTNQVTYMQDRAGWIKPAGKGLVIYLMPGHTKHDFETDPFGRIVLNAVIYQP